MAENTGKKSPQLLFAEAAKIARFPAGSMWPDELSEKQLICLMSGVWMGDDCKQKEVYTGLIDSAIRQGSLKFRNIEKPIRKRRRVINSANHSSPLYFSNLPHNSPPHMETSQTRAIKFVDRQSVADWLKTSEEQPTEHITEWLRTGEVNTDEANSESKLIIDRANKIKEILSTKYSDIMDLPYNAKNNLRNEFIGKDSKFLGEPLKFTKSTFDKAWQYGNENGFFSLAIKGKFSSRTNKQDN
jgi:hypothetical protein